MIPNENDKIKIKKIKITNISLSKENKPKIKDNISTKKNILQPFNDTIWLTGC
tara:strand:+ start:2262 stop:2420 length:159 start_codon:yes stop_codon:yes gene_type:complete